MCWHWQLHHHFGCSSHKLAQCTHTGGCASASTPLSSSKFLTGFGGWDCTASSDLSASAFTPTALCCAPFMCVSLVEVGGEEYLCGEGLPSICHSGRQLGYHKPSFYLPVQVTIFIAWCGPMEIPRCDLAPNDHCIDQASWLSVLTVCCALPCVSYSRVLQV